MAGGALQDGSAKNRRRAGEGFPRWARGVLFFLALALLAVPAPRANAGEGDEGFPAITLWPLVWHRESAQEAVTDVLWPVFQAKRQGTRRRLAIRPFLFSLETDPVRDFRRLDLLWPVARFERERERQERYVFPLYWQGRRKGEEWLHLWPLYGSSRQADGTRVRSTLYPFFSYRSNEKTASWSLDAPWPLVNLHRAENAAGGRLFPLFWRERSGEGRSGFLFPYYWHRTEGARSDGILPLWFRRRASGSRLDLIFPFYLAYGDAERSLRLFLPLFLQSRDPETKTSLLLPFWFSRTAPEGRLDTLFPLYWRHDTPASRFTLLAPLYAGYRGEKSETSLWLPFYFRHADREAGSELRYYFPFYGRYTLGDRISRHLLFFPLYSHYVDLERDHHSWNFLWPLIHHETAPDFYQSWALPLYWSSRSPAGRQTMALGLYWATRREGYRHTFLFPFYWHSRDGVSEQRHILPLYSDIRRGVGQRKRFILGPLWIETVDAERSRRQLDVLWPLICRKEEGSTRHLRIFPFYLHEERPGESLSFGSLALLPPYYVRKENRDGALRHLWPFLGFLREGDYREYSVLWPFLRWGQDPDGGRRTRQFFLAYHFADGEAVRTGLFPLWHHGSGRGEVSDLSLLHWYRRDRKKGLAQISLLHLGSPDLSLFNHRRQGADRHHHLFPLYSYTRDEKDDETRLSVLGPVYTFRRKGAETTQNRFLWKVLYAERGPERDEWGLLWRFLHSLREGETRIFEFNPFYYREERSDGVRYVAFLGGIYAAERRGSTGRKRLLWLFSW